MKFDIWTRCLLISTIFVYFSIGVIDATRNEVNDDEERWKLGTGTSSPGLKLINSINKLLNPLVGSGIGPIEVKIFFHLYTKRNATLGQELKIDPKSLTHLSETSFDRRNPTVFITHGWRDKADGVACPPIRDAYLKTNANVILVDWSMISNQLYLLAARKVEAVGKHVSKMIDYLHSYAGLDLKKTTLIGHSLGAHIMGIAGYHSKDSIKTIIGLDPAGPLFEPAPSGKRICTRDAEYVQIIHTNGGLLGFLEPIGHSDFYVNGGKSQPGCELLDVTGGLCSHLRAPEYFAESIDPHQKFRSSLCADLSDVEKRDCKETDVEMGGTGPTAQGIYYVETSPTSPFARG